eukprot:CAMPEP_0203814692 /NCGR_PEP_ID=MMETSP0115-20131106/5434_1 /ASSEMBLY_ACC=CAM_ASM_000227 /TAXON_ID=33651 /ORGANISM="Bicosoecid sp, Strain ms1" /LENGTH=62 /DNA_ID=CAMNT_0050723573 /DNA_START=69 /DNA_END=254 /DNA_ORIENTATION=-
MSSSCGTQSGDSFFASSALVMRFSYAAHDSSNRRRSSSICRFASRASTAAFTYQVVSSSTAG